MRAALRRLLLLAVVACVAGPVELAHAGPMRTASLASNGRPDRIESFADGAGRQFLVGTDLPGVDLASFARILIGTIHGNELRRVQVLVARRTDLDSLCDEQAAACYFGADDGSGRGQINVAADDPSLRHSLIHEYGHHIDNQLVGIGKGISLNGLSCSVGGDGSRRLIKLRLTLPTLLGLKLVAPAHTRFELRLVRAGHLLSRSAGRGRKQVLRPVLESGSYLLIVRSLAGRGPFRVAIVER